MPSLSNPLLLFGILGHLLLLAAVGLIVLRSIKQANLNFNSKMLLLASLAFAAFILYQSPQDASNLPVVPDSVEYAVGANRIVELGLFDIVVDGISRPSRYPPGFSLLGLAPYLFVLGADVGNAIWFVLVSALTAVLAAFLIGQKLHKTSGALWSVALLMLTHFSRASAYVSPHASCVALTLVLLLAYLELREAPEQGAGFWFSIGILLAVGTSFRPLSLFLVVPFIAILARRPQARAVKNGLLLLAPLAAELLGSLWYNRQTFGSALRTGYSYWCSVPYDYFLLTFNARYLADNLSRLLQTQVLPFGVITLVALLLNSTASPATKRQTTSQVIGGIRAMLIFAALGIGPLALIHLFYFYPEAWFFVPLEAVMAVCAAVSLVEIFRCRAVSPRFGNMALLAVACVLLRLPLQPETGQRLTRRQSVDQLNALLPDNAILISSLDPVYLETLFLRNTHRRAIPTSREVEYASKLVMPSAPDKSALFPTSWNQHRGPFQLESGAREAVSAVAIENPSEIARNLESGREVFFQTDQANPNELRRMQKLFQLSEVRQGIYQQVLAVRDPAGR